MFIEKQRKKYQDQIILLERGKFESVKLSNPRDFLNFSMKRVTKIDRIWLESPISQKRIIQRLAFPAGVQYNKLEQTCRTPKINSIFQLTHSISAIYRKGHKKTPTVVRVEYQRRESNPHIFRYTSLSRARLPIPPLWLENHPF